MATKLLIGAAAMVVALAQDSLGASEASVADRRLGTRHGDEDALTPELVPHDGKERRRFFYLITKMLEEQEAKKREEEERARQRALELAAKIVGSIDISGSAFGIRDGGRRRAFFLTLRSIIYSLTESVERLKESKMQSGFMQKAADQLADKIDEMRDLFQRLGYDDGVSELFELKAQLLPLIEGGLEHGGENCWGQCGLKSGPCEWCGTGKCCRKGWRGGEKGCAVDEGFSFHGCVPGGGRRLEADTNSLPAPGREI